MYKFCERRYLQKNPLPKFPGPMIATGNSMRLRPHLPIVLAATLAAAACSKPNADEHAKKGDGFVEQKLFSEASIEYRAAIQADSNRGDIRLKLGDIYLRLDDAAGALREYVRAADLLPDNADAQLKAGKLLLLAGKFEDAKGRAKRAVELDPKNAQAQIVLGNTMAGMKDVDGALAEYSQALALDPAADVAYRNIATLKLSQGQPQAGWRLTIGRGGDLLQNRSRIVGSFGDDVVVRESEAGFGRLRLARNRLEVGLRVLHAVRAHVEDAEGPVGLEIVGVKRERLLQSHFGIGRPA